ncbi:MAG: calcium-binding protein [Phycisphaerae bacterium]|nr:calcium-binding protein [Phycisphaerae bacterium]
MAKRRPNRDKKREQRIEIEVVVDAYDAGERAMGWYYYLEDKLQFPFTTLCIAHRSISPLRVDDEVEVIGMLGEDDCRREMFVSIRWDRKGGVAVPLSQLKPIGDTDEQTRQAIGDWHYWVAVGFEF